VQFGRTLNTFGLIKEKFGQMALDGYAIESMAYMTTGMIDRGDPDCYVEAAMCKVYGSEASWRTVNECIQVRAQSRTVREEEADTYYIDRHRPIDTNVRVHTQAGMLIHGAGAGWAGLHGGLAL
jgi:alkylation response protein AidB-like acyl-CoA dehydrogenase